MKNFIIGMLVFASAGAFAENLPIGDRFDFGREIKGKGEDLQVIRDLGVLWKCKMKVQVNEESLNVIIMVKRDYPRYSDQKSWQKRVNATLDRATFEKAYDAAKNAATEKTFEVNVPYSDSQQMTMTFDSNSEKLISILDFYRFPSLGSTECVRR